MWYPSRLLRGKPAKSVAAGAVLRPPYASKARGPLTSQVPPCRVGSQLLLRSPCCSRWVSWQSPLRRGFQGRLPGGLPCKAVRCLTSSKGSPCLRGSLTRGPFALLTGYWFPHHHRSSGLSAGGLAVVRCAKGGPQEAVVTWRVPSLPHTHTLYGGEVSGS